MHYKSLVCIYSTLFFALPYVKPLGISSKLDFDEPTFSNVAHNSAIKKETNQQYFSDIAGVRVHTNKNSDDFDNIGVVCISTGCNTTKNNVDTKDIIKTDVIVQVKTKIDLSDKNDKNFNKKVEDIPDVPVVIGYGGLTSTESKIEVNTEGGRSININPVLTTLDRPSYSAFSQQLTPLNKEYFIPKLSSVIDDEPKVDIALKTKQQTVVVSNKEDESIFKNKKNKENGIELQIPYFDPSYTNPYFAEYSPPQLLWYPKNTVSYNPVEFKTTKRTWNIQTWTTKRPTYHKHTDLACSCQKQNGGLEWYPSPHSRQISINQQQHPGSQISGKLGPLD